MIVGAMTLGVMTMRMAVIVDRFVVMSVAAGMGHGKRLCCTGVAEGLPQPSNVII